MRRPQFVFFTVVASCCDVVVCVRFTGTRCKVVLCLLDGKAFGERVAYLFCLLLFLAVVWWFVCGPQAPDVK